MEKKIICLILAILTMLVGCGSSKPADIALEDLQNSEEKYMVFDLEWGSSDNTVENRLGIKFEDTPFASKDTMVIYNSDEELKILDYDANVQAEYQDGGLSVLTFSLITADPEAAYQEIGEKLEKAYGEHSTTENDFGYGVICNKLWINEAEETTVLQLTYMEDHVSIALGLN